MDITPYLKLMLEKQASDLFLISDSPVKIKSEGQAAPVGETVLTPKLTQNVAYELMNEQQQARFEAHMECDFAISLQEKGRFRVNVYRERGRVGLVLRLIPDQIPTAEALGMPPILTELILLKRGLILMVGATGSGKSTTLAAMLNHRNATQSGHILTIEDPIEFNHPNLKSVVSQREIGVDTLSYANALKAALREAPDVILIGEIRDVETMQAAIELANTGHLVIATLHANNANQAMERIINLFPQDRHKQLFMDLSLNLRAVISPRLVLGVDGRRTAAFEVLISTPHIAELILKGDLDELKTAMTDSGQKGMQTFDQALLRMYQEERISLEEALANADSRTNLETKINFG